MNGWVMHERACVHDHVVNMELERLCRREGLWLEWGLDVTHYNLTTFCTLNIYSNGTGVKLACDL